MLVSNSLFLPDCCNCLHFSCFEDGRHALPIGTCRYCGTWNNVQEKPCCCPQNQTEGAGNFSLCTTSAGSCPVPCDVSGLILLNFSKLKIGVSWEAEGPNFGRGGTIAFNHQIWFQYTTSLWATKGRSQESGDLPEGSETSCNKSHKWYVSYLCFAVFLHGSGNLVIPDLILHICRLRTTLVIQFKPHYIAAGSLSLSARFHNVRLPTEKGKVWWHQFDVAPKQLEGTV